MRKILTLALSVLLMLSAAGCGNNAELELLKKENEELKQQINTSNATTPPTDKVESTSNDDLTLNSPFEISTEYGTYKITLLSITKKDWRDKGSAYEYPTLVISYEVENVNFKNEYYAGVLVNGSLFYVYDKNKSILEEQYSGYDITYPDTVLPGYKGKFDVCYKLKDDTDTVDIILHRNDANGRETILGQLTANIE